MRPVVTRAAAIKPDHGAVLINALVIVLVISAITAALLTRAETARLRGAAGQGSAQLALYLDGIEGLLPSLLKEPLTEGNANLGQTWAGRDFSYEIDRGSVTARLSDMQGRLNVNWLMAPDDAWVADSFAGLFSELGVPQSLLLAITEYVRPNGPRSVNAYLARSPPVAPKGGPLRLLAELRLVEGMTEDYFAELAPYLTALPVEARLNLNTAAKPVLRAVLAPFPSEVISETLARGADDPLQAMSEFRNRVIEILQTEDLGDLPVDRLHVSSTWFQAALTATLGDRSRVRQVVLFHDPAEAAGTQVKYRWTEYD